MSVIFGLEPKILIGVYLDYAIFEMKVEGRKVEVYIYLFCAYYFCDCLFLIWGMESAKRSFYAVLLQGQEHQLVGILGNYTSTCSCVKNHRLFYDQVLHCHLIQIYQLIATLTCFEIRAEKRSSFAVLTMNSKLKKTLTNSEASREGEIIVLIFLEEGIEYVFLRLW